MPKRILAIMGSYRKNGIVDRLVDETLASAAAAGAQTRKICLVDQHLEFCTNCRQCTAQPGLAPGQCVHQDDMAAILREWQESDALVLGAPVNFYNVTAIHRRFMERLICFAYWPWGQMGPQMRTKLRPRKAVLITASGMPALLGRVLTGAPRALRLTAETLGAKPIQTIFAGMVSQEQHQPLPAKAVRQAQAAGRRLAGRGR